MKRRRLLAIAGLGLTGAIAGCGEIEEEDDDGDANGDDPGTTDDSTGTDPNGNGNDNDGIETGGQLVVDSVSGIVGGDDEIHEVRVTVTAADDSAAVDLSTVVFSQFFLLLPGGDDHRFLTTLEINDFDGDVTAETDPATVTPGVGEIDGEPVDVFGVNVVSAASEDNLLVEPGDEYQLVVATPGGTNEEGLQQLLSPVPEDELQIELKTDAGFLPQMQFVIPSLEDYDDGDEVEF